MKKTIFIGLIIISTQAFCAQQSSTTTILESLKNGGAYLIDTVKANPYMTALVTITGLAFYKCYKSYKAIKPVVIIFKNPHFDGSKLKKAFCESLYHAYSCRSKWIVWYPYSNQTLEGEKAKEFIKLLDPSLLTKQEIYSMRATYWIPELKKSSLQDFVSILKASPEIRKDCKVHEENKEYFKVSMQFLNE